MAAMIHLDRVNIVWLQIQLHRVVTYQLWEHEVWLFYQDCCGMTRNNSNHIFKCLWKQNRFRSFLTFSMVTSHFVVMQQVHFQTLMLFRVWSHLEETSMVIQIPITHLFNNQMHFQVSITFSSRIHLWSSQKIYKMNKEFND